MNRTILELNRSRITAMLPVKDLERARRFYEQQLGFERGAPRPDGKYIYRCEGTEIALFPRPGGTKAECEAAQQAAMTKEALTRVGSRTESICRTGSRHGTRTGCTTRRSVTLPGCCHGPSRLVDRAEGSPRHILRA